MSWNVPVVIIPFLVFSGVQWSRVRNHCMALAWLPQYFVCLVIRRYRIMRWSGDQSQLGCQCNVSYFFSF